MSHAFYNVQWQSAMEALSETYQVENPNQDDEDKKVSE